MMKSALGSSASEPVSHALIGIARDLELRMLTRLHDERGYEGLRPSLGPFLSLIWLEARPLGELAQCLGVSKQACSQLAGLALKAGYLARRSASGAARGQVVELSSRGRALVDDAIRIIDEAESDYVTTVGEARFRRLADAVAKLYRSLDVQPRVDANRAGSVAPPLGGLPQLAIELQRRLIDATAVLGHRGLKPSQALVLPLIGRDGTRIRDLARRYRVSRQSISLTGLELESLGYLRRKPDPTDRRGTILHRTPRGDRLLADAVEAAGALDRKLEKDLDKAQFEDLRETAHLLFADLQASDDPEAPVWKSRLRLRVVTAPPEPSPSESDLDLLASSLRLRLGDRDAARLAALLVANRHASSSAGGERRPRRSRA